MAAAAAAAKARFEIAEWIMNLDLPHTQRDLLARIDNLHRLKGCFASDAELARHVDRSPETVRGHRALLVKAGYLETAYGPHPSNPRRTTRFLVPCLPTARNHAESNQAVTARNHAPQS